VTDHLRLRCRTIWRDVSLKDNPNRARVMLPHNTPFALSNLFELRVPESDSRKRADARTFTRSNNRTCIHPGISRVEGWVSGRRV
jgi:hypothetical protein